MAILQKSSERLENISKTAESLISADAASDAVAQVTKMYGLLEMYKKARSRRRRHVNANYVSEKQNSEVRR